MAKPPMQELQVVRSERITDNMLRITLGGNPPPAIPSDHESAYIKLVFPRGDGERPLLRTYTIRHQRPTEIDVDFALHGQMGPATAWAVNSQPGDRILIGGPGPKKLIEPDADWYLLAGDMTALPAISVNLQALPAHARGHAVLEVRSEADIQPLDHPESMIVHWEVNPQPDPDGAFLLSKIRALPWLEGQPAVWAACEFSSMRSLRRYFKQECGIPKSQLYVSSYWKIGLAEEDHKQAKLQDAEEAEAA